MGKVAGVAAVAFLFGGGAMTVLTGALGTYAEVAALALMGAGMVGSGMLMAAPKAPARPKLVTKAGQTQQQGA